MIQGKTLTKTSLSMNLFWDEMNLNIRPKYQLERVDGSDGDDYYGVESVSI